MATTFDVLYLGVQADMDTVGGDQVAENAAALEGLTIGSASDPLYGHVQTLSPGTTGYTGGSSSRVYERDEANETFRIDGGPDQSYDMGMPFNATLTYTDGTTAVIRAMVFQDHDGNTYLAPRETYDASRVAMEAQPIMSITLNSAIYSDEYEGGWDLIGDRYDGSFAQPGPVDGSAGDDVMVAGYVDGDGDIIDGVDGVDDIIFGWAGNDGIHGGAGADTIEGGLGADTIEGGAGNDVVSGGDGADTFIFFDGDGADIITDFDLADDDLDGFTNDRLDLSALTDSGGNPVNIWDVVVSDTVGDGSGDAILTFPTGESLTLTGVDPGLLDATMMQAMGIPCLAAGTLIDTPEGARPVEKIEPGDRVTTQGGAQPVVWAASRRLDAAALAAEPRLCPVRIRAGALGNRRDLLVSPQHRIALGTAGAPTGLAPARWLAEDGDGRFRLALGRRGVTYVHLLLPRHALIRAEGAWVESFYPGPQGLAALDPAARADLFARFPDFAGIGTRPDAQRAYGPLALKEIRRRDLARFICVPARAAAAGTANHAGAPARLAGARARSAVAPVPACPDAVTRPKPAPA